MATIDTGSRRHSHRLVLSMLAFAAWSLAALRAQGQPGPIQGTNWFPIGPADFSSGQTYGDGRVNASGRATVIAVNPSNRNDVWLGTATGGVWHSTNGGVNWLPMSDNEASLSIGAVALDGCNGDGCATIYAGTGENAIRRDTYYGMGLLIGQMSGGEFPAFGWTLKGADLFRFASINNVVLDPTTSGGNKTIYVSLSSGVTASATESTVTAPPPVNGYGIYKSTNQGNAWTKLTVSGAAGSKPTDLEMDPTNPQILYAGFQGKGLFKSTNGGTSWCPLNPGIPLPTGCVAATGLPDPTTTTFDHVEIAVFKPNPAILYSVLGNCPDPLGNGPIFGGACSPLLFKSTDGGQTWTSQNGAAPSAYSRYTHALAIHPADSATVFYGGLQLYKSTNSGQVFTGLGNNVHPDHHALVFPDPNDPSRLYDASDGGFASSVDGGSSWSSGNSDLQITGFQSMSWSPLTARVIGGTQDNGTNMWLGTRIWEHRDDGDSASSLMDFDDVMTMYDVYVMVDPRRATDGGTCCGWSSITNGLTTGDPSALYPPLAQGPGAHPLYFGTNRLYKTTDNGGTWAPVSPVLGGTGTMFPDIQRTNVITAIAPAPSNGDRIYVGYYDGQIFKTDSPCATNACWTSIGGTAKGLPATVVTRIAVDPNNANVAYATFSGFQTGPHVFKTTNGGTTWASVGKNLPEIPINTITIETSSILWVGADDGVYRSANGGGDWSRAGTGLPKVPVYEIALDIDRGRLYAGTHGRGAWILTRPFLSNFEGWVNNDIWDIPVYGTGFVGSLTNPAGSPCTMQIIQQNGAVCSSSTKDVMGGNITFNDSGDLVTSKNSFWNNKPVAWACFNGSCIGNKTIAQCNPSSNPITSVTVTCGTQVGIDHILGCPAQANPPSSILGLSGMPGGDGGGGGGGGGGGEGGGSERAMRAEPAPAEPGPAQKKRAAKPHLPSPPSTILAAPNSLPMAEAASFDLIPTIQGRDGTRALCTAKVSLAAGDSPLDALLKSRDAVNGNAACQQEPVTAIVSGVPPEAIRGEDLLYSPPTLKVRAPNAVGGQLFTAIRAPAGDATKTCFDVSGIGVPVQNQVAVMKIELDTPSGGAAGGELTVLERSPLGACSVQVKTAPGESAAQIATAVMNAFQAPGVPGAPRCPAAQNPRDVTVEGSQIISVLATELRVCTTDQGLGIFIGPKELGDSRRLSLQYAVKLLCGPSEKTSSGKPDSRVAPGRYFTTVNLHNPSGRRVSARFKVAVALPGKPGPISRFVSFVLGPDDAISIDCAQLLERLGVTSGFNDGFIVVESEGELDVVAVYTAAGATGKVETLGTERVPGRLR